MASDATEKRKGGRRKVAAADRRQDEKGRKEAKGVARDVLRCYE